jgi:hypothetical protein
MLAVENVAALRIEKVVLEIADQPKRILPTLRPHLLGRLPDPLQDANAILEVLSDDALQLNASVPQRGRLSRGDDRCGRGEGVQRQVRERRL